MKVIRSAAWRYRADELELRVHYLLHRQREPGTNDRQLELLHDQLVERRETSRLHLQKLGHFALRI